MKKLPIGVQSFPEIINGNYVYVDKTQLIHRMIDSGKVYFLSRPRRFGKSLTVSTLEEIFKGNKKLFEGLWIYDKIDWQPYPVIHIDFSELSKKNLPLTDSIHLVLNEIANGYNIDLKQSHYALKFRELIRALAKEKPVVILIDEYDKPIIDYLEKEKISLAIENRETLKDLYSVLKGNDANISFLLMTGVSKFSKLSVFSDLNHLDDITIDQNYSTLCGYTEEELLGYFGEYITDIKSDQLTHPEFMNEIRGWYDGYSWDGENFVYNPFSILYFLSKRKFDDYWFRSGTPTFLMKLVKERNFQVSWMEGMHVDSNAFEQFDIENLEITPLLMQTGYLTIKNYDYSTRLYTLQYPNNEVRKSFNDFLLRTLSENPGDNNAVLLYELTASLEKKDTAKFFKMIKVLFKNITYPLIDEKEKYFHSIFYTMLKLLGFRIETEILTSDGRIDAVIKTKEFIYILEFKMGTAEEALAQIKRKEYALKYAADHRQIVLLGIGFDTELKNVENYIEE